MKIEKDTLKIWLKHFNQLDYSLVAMQIGVSTQTIYNALSGSCSQKTHDKINNYILERKRMLNELKEK